MNKFFLDLQALNGHEAKSQASKFTVATVDSRSLWTRQSREVHWDEDVAIYGRRMADGLLMLTRGMVEDMSKRDQENERRYLVPENILQTAKEVFLVSQPKCVYGRTMITLPCQLGCIPFVVSAKVGEGGDPDVKLVGTKDVESWISERGIQIDWPEGANDETVQAFLEAWKEYRQLPASRGELPADHVIKVDTLAALSHEAAAMAGSQGEQCVDDHEEGQSNGWF